MVGEARLDRNLEVVEAHDLGLRVGRLRCTGGSPSSEELREVREAMLHELANST